MDQFIELLVWLIPLPPALAFFVIILFTNKNRMFFLNAGNNGTSHIATTDDSNFKFHLLSFLKLSAFGCQPSAFAES